MPEYSSWETAAMQSAKVVEGLWAPHPLDDREALLEKWGLTEDEDEVSELSLGSLSSGTSSGMSGGLGGGLGGGGFTFSKSSYSPKGLSPEAFAKAHAESLKAVAKSADFIYRIAADPLDPSRVARGFDWIRSAAPDFKEVDPTIKLNDLVDNLILASNRLLLGQQDIRAMGNDLKVNCEKGFSNFEAFVGAVYESDHFKDEKVKDAVLKEAKRLLSDHMGQLQLATGRSLVTVNKLVKVFSTAQLAMVHNQNKMTRATKGAMKKVERIIRDLAKDDIELRKMKKYYNESIVKYNALTHEKAIPPVPEKLVSDVGKCDKDNKKCFKLQEIS
jgi:hypothetical protein